jgi:hypothetical protein
VVLPHVLKEHTFSIFQLTELVKVDGEVMRWTNHALAILEDNEIDCLEFPTPTGSEQTFSSSSAFHSCNWPNSLRGFPYNQHTFFHHMTSVVLKMETVCPPEVSEHSVTTWLKNPKEKYNLSVCYLFPHVSPLKFVTKNPNFEHQLIYEYLKNR